MSACHVCGTCGSGIVSSAADVPWMSVVRGMGGVGGVCKICMGLDDMIGFGLYQSCGIRGSVGRVCVFGLRCCGWGVCRSLEPGSGGWYYLCVSCESGFSA